MTRYQRNAGVEAAPMQSETVLYNADTNDFCVLNETAAFLWELLEQPRTIEELSTELCNGFDGVDADPAREDVRVTLEKFTELRMLATLEEDS